MPLTEEGEDQVPGKDLFLTSIDSKTGKLKMEGFNPEVLKVIDDFPVHEDDVYLCGFPKSGNVWTGTIIGAILSEDDLETFTNTPPDQTRMIDFFPEIAKNHPLPGHFMSHLPYGLLPKGVREKKVKVINVMRKPKDVAVSFYHFHSVAKQLLPFAKPWDEFFEEFMDGSNIHGDYYNHIKSFWEIRDQPYIFLLEYEDLKKNPRHWIAKIAEFMGKPLDDEKLDKIVEITEFSNMKKSQLNPSNLPLFVQGGQFMRKGQVGDWRSLFSEDQKKRFDEATKKFFEDIGRPVPAE